MSHTSDTESAFSRPYPKNSRQITHAHTWQDFHRFICIILQKTGVVIPAYDQLPETRNISFKDAVTEAKDHAKSSESVLTNACLHQLTLLGHIVLVDTNDKVSDLTTMKETTNESATVSHRCKSDMFVSEFCKACSGGGTVHEYTRSISTGGNDRHTPGTSGALPTPGHILPQLRSSLNPDRCWPVNIVAVIEIKSGTDAINARSKVRQSAQYLESVLEGTPRRDVAFGVVTNLTECIFIAVTFRIGTKGRRIYVSYHSAVIPRTNLVQELTSFVSTPAAALGHTFRFPVSVFTPTEFLGRGSTSTAILGRWQGQELVMKLSVHHAPMEVERRVARYASRLDIAGVPRIHEACQEEVGGLLYGNCNVFTERYAFVVYVYKCYLLQSVRVIYFIL